MLATAKSKTNAPLVLGARTVAELMTPNPVSINDGATVREAESLLLDKGFSAAPVIDEAGHPLGVVSRTDLLIHEHEGPSGKERRADYFAQENLRLSTGEKLKEGFEVENVDYTRVRDIMTPVVFAVDAEAPPAKAVEGMLDYNIHRIFVVDGSGVLVGVVSAMDILRHLVRMPKP